jgi:hypothetical protein
MLGACLNPVNFTEDSLPRIPVDVTGSLEVTISDVAVMWLINRTKTVDVREFKIERPKGANETDEQYIYPKTYDGRPKAGSSLASYHNPTEAIYTVSVVCEDENKNIKVIPPFEVQFPKPQDYRFYLYWTVNGDLVLVNEDKMQELPPDPDNNYTDVGPNPSSVNAQTFVVLNVTADQNLDGVEFYKNPSTYVLANEPKARDQKMILLGSGPYVAQAHYTRGGTPYTTTEKNVTVAKEDGSMAVRTNFVYFYKTKDGDYQLSQNWPPIPNDASDENKPEDALLETQGILEIRNNAVPNNPHSLIARININGDEYPNNTDTGSYMGPGDDPKRYILNVGPVTVMFRPTDQTFYGQVSNREIVSRQVTVLSYTNDLGNPFAFPEDTGNGSGLIQIQNNTTGVVVSVAVSNQSNVIGQLQIDYEDFVPPYAINYGKIGIVPVVGTGEVPLEDGRLQRIDVQLETVDGLVTVTRLAALKDQIVTIVLNEDSLNPGGNSSGGRYGSKVVVKNQTTTSTNILGMYVYNKDNVGSSAMYYLDIPSPPSSQKNLYVLSTVGLPIASGEQYAARLSVYGNGQIGLIEKEFDEGTDLYSLTPDSHIRTITLNQSDLPLGLIEVFIPVEDITITPDPYTLTSYVETDPDGGNPALVYTGAMNLNQSVVVEPLDATKKGPISWQVVSGGGSQYVSLNSSGVLTVVGIAPAGSRRVTVQATIADAAGTLQAKQPFTTEIYIDLAYHNTQVRDRKVTGLTLTSGVELQAGNTLDLRTLVTLSPDNPSINGVPITADVVEWQIVANTGGSSLGGGYILTGGTGSTTVTIKGTVPPGKTGSGSAIEATQTITITSAAPAFYPLTGITLNNGSPYRLDFYTVTSGGSKRVYASNGFTPILVFNPANATVQSPVFWTAVNGVTSAVKFKNQPDDVSPIASTLQVKEDLYGSQVPANNSTVGIKARVPGARGMSGDYESSIYTVTLVEHHSRPVATGEFTLGTGAVIEVDQVDDLNYLVGLPADAMYDNTPITAADLVWSIVSGGPGELEYQGAGVFKGKVPGYVTVKATLPAEVNYGQILEKTTQVLVREKPPVYPTTLTLRIIKLNSSDYVNQIALQPVTSDAYSPAIRSTGHTKVQWAFGSGKTGVTKKKEFVKSYLSPPNQYITITKIDKTNDWTDVTIPWPTGNVTGYNLFFIEGDTRVRGYVNPGRLDPDQKENFLFFLRPDVLYNNYRLWMKADKQATDNTGGAIQVVPIGYNSYYNTASIMKAAGVGNQPTHDLSDF